MVYSLTPFFTENDIAEIRFATLDPVVDIHVVGESRLTHSGQPKPLNFDHDRFKQWAHKIRYIEIDLDNPPPLRHGEFYTQGATHNGDAAKQDWMREKEHRRQLIKGFDGKPDDLILLSDLDEIPHPDAVACGQENILLCRMHVARLNYRWETEAHESHSICRIFPAHKFADLEEARLTHMPPLGPAGWHLSWMQDMGTKLAAFVHQEL